MAASSDIITPIIERPFVVYDSSGNVAGFYNRDRTVTYITAQGTVVGNNAGTPSQLITANAGTGNTVGALRFTINPGDDTIGGQRLLVPDANTLVISAVGQAMLVRLTAPLSRLHAAAVSSSTTYTGASYVIGSAETDLSDAMANDLRLDFDTADNVREVLISWIAGTTTQTGLISVVGITH